MLYPTINELTKGEYNRYELALATAKCARIITGEYVRQREAAERSMTGSKDTDRPLISMIDAEYRDAKAVKIAVSRLSEGDYEIVRLTPEEMEEEAARAAELESRGNIYSDIPDDLPEDLTEEAAEEESSEAEEDADEEETVTENAEEASDAETEENA